MPYHPDRRTSEYDAVGHQRCLAAFADFFDDELLVQVGRKMQPTPYARELREPVREQITFEQYMEMGHTTVGFGSSQRLSIEDW